MGGPESDLVVVAIKNRRINSIFSDLILFLATSILLHCLQGRKRCMEVGGFLILDGCGEQGNCIHTEIFHYS